MRVLGMIKEVKRYYKRKMKYCIVRSEHVLRCEKSMYEPWIMEEWGTGVCKPVMIGLTERLIKQNQERTIQVIQSPMVKDPSNEPIPEPVQKKSSHELHSNHQPTIPSPTKPSLRSPEPVKVAPLTSDQVITAKAPMKIEKPVSNDTVVEVPKEKPSEPTPKHVEIKPVTKPNPPEVVKPVKSPPKSKKQVKDIVEDEEEVWEDNWDSTESSSDFIPETVETDESSTGETEKSSSVAEPSKKEIKGVVSVNKTSKKEEPKKILSTHLRRKEYELQGRQMIRQREEEQNLRRQRAAELRRAREERRLQLREEQILMKINQRIQLLSETKELEIEKAPEKTEPSQTKPSQPEVIKPAESLKRTESLSDIPPEKRIRKQSLWEEARAAYLNEEDVTEKELPLTAQEENTYWNSKYIQESRFILRSDPRNQSSIVYAVEIRIECNCRSVSSEMH